MEDAPKPTPLLIALAEAAGGADPTKRRRIYEEMLRGSLLLELSRPMKNPGDPLRLIGMVSHDERKGLAAFTDEGSMRLFKPSAAHFIALPATAIFRMALENGFDAVLLNPPGIAWEVTQEEFAELAEGRVPENRPQPQQTMVRCEIRPLGREVPADVAAAIAGALAPYPEVKGAWFFLMTMAHEAPQAALGFELSGSTGDFPALARKMEENGFQLPELEDLDYSCGPLTPDMLPGVIRLGTKVYQR
jgi:hypothetical protein